MLIRLVCCCAGAFGYLEVTHDITRYCKAKVFSTVGKRTPIAVRFSTVGEGGGSGVCMVVSGEGWSVRSVSGEGWSMHGCEW